MKIITFCIAIALSASAIADEDSKLELSRKLMWAAAAADIVSTELALRQPNTVEGNPLMEKRAVRIGAKLGASFAIDHFTGKLKNKKAAFWLRMGVAIGWGFAAGWNFTVAF